ncbi:MAG: hypothetical protein DRI56_13150, partial [Chloroflexota bacterium]
MTRRPAFYFFLIIAAIFSTTLGFACYYYHQSVYKPITAAADRKIDLTIQPGESGFSVIKKLNDHQLIRSTFFAKIFFILQQKKGLGIQAGDYKLGSSMSLAEMYKIFQHGTFDVKLTIPEGLRLEEIAQIV